MSNSQQVSEAYLRERVMNTPPEELPLLCFDFSLSQLEQAKILAEGDSPAEIQGFAKRISKVQSIILNLLAALDMEQGGEVAANLQQQYMFLNGYLNEALIERDGARIEEAHKIITNLRDGWKGALAELRK